jgi:hypothetical protein
MHALAGVIAKVRRLAGVERCPISSPPYRQRRLGIEVEMADAPDFFVLGLAVAIAATFIVTAFLYF